ncbi:nucleoside hydrolase [Weissella coleopterorum]|uniref:Nucleoside hydrolase n=1 Tax=Weissella coleopterorum TaxID=2714949 RepID=A0A6G8B076_9LACO|nr:nucleoside hydrolase [Weissella coleopterorum]QIL50622.1 nucleoside hydrolase [Weissella coleopterorum]
MVKKIWIDCDPGHDDALAILTALAYPEKLKLLGVSTIGGNESLDKVTNNAKNILHLLNAKVPLIPGERGPLVKSLRSAPEAHGESGMDGIEFVENDYPISKTNLIEYWYQLLIDSIEPITMVAIGPLTNLALLLKTYPEIKTKIEAICLMGGGIDHGNITPAAEFNIYVDPEAAQIVYQSGIPIVMAGLDVTEKSYLTRLEIDQLKQHGSISQKIYGLLDFYNKSGRQFGFEVSPMHDLCTIVYLLNPEVFNGKNYSIEIVTDEGLTRGMTLADLRKKPVVKNETFVLLESDREKYVTYLMESLAYFDQKVSMKEGQ